MKHSFAFCCLVLSICLPVGFAHAMVINFDDTATGQGAPVVAYLANHGITFIAGPGAGNAIIQGNQAPQVTSPSAPNVFGVGGILSDYSYIFEFAGPISSFSFTTPALGSSSTMAAWNATAYSSSNAILSSILNQYFIHGPNAAQATWTLNGASIDHIEFHSNVQGFAGSALIMDDLTFDLPATAPEPGALWLLGGGLLALAGLRRREISMRCYGG
jgi:hypothetical protein